MKYIYITITDLRITKETTGKIKHDLYLKNTYDAYFLDMTPPEEVLFKNIDRKCRQNIKRFEKVGGVIKEDYSKALLYEHNKQKIDVYAKHGQINNDTTKKLEKIYQHVKPGMLLSIRADIPEHENIASSNFVGHGDICFYMSNASYRPYLLARPNQMLMWYGVSYYKNMGIKIMDLGVNGDYKLKYGAVLKKIPILIYTKYRILQLTMDALFNMYYRGYKFLGKLLHKH